MKSIEYRAVYQSPSGRVVDNKFEVVAKDINSGFRKAVEKALRDTASRWEIHSVEFVQVLS